MLYGRRMDSETIAAENILYITIHALLLIKLAQFVTSLILRLTTK